MSKVSMFGSFSCAEGKGEEMDAALAAQTAVFEKADGIESYSYHKSEDGSYRFFALFSSMEAVQRQGETEEMKAVMAPFMALLGGPPEMSMTTPIAADR